MPADMGSHGPDRPPRHGSRLSCARERAPVEGQRFKMTRLLVLITLVAFGCSSQTPPLVIDAGGDSPAAVDGDGAERADVDGSPGSDTDSGARTCGGENQPCCPTGMSECNSLALACSWPARTCQPCGGLGQICCIGGCNDPNTGCGGLIMKCSHCGDQGEPCCGMAHTCSFGTCQMTTDVGNACM